MATPKKDPKDYLPRGRPTTYSPEIANLICDEIAAGKSLTEICNEYEHIPPRQDVYVWLDKYPEFNDAFIRARQRSAYHFEDECLAIARAAEIENAHVARLQVDTLKWAASKRNSGVYGEKAAHNSITQVNINTSQEQAKQTVSNFMAKVMAELAKEQQKALGVDGVSGSNETPLVIDADDCTHITIDNPDNTDKASE